MYKTIKELLEDIEILRLDYIMSSIIHKLSVLLKISRILKHFLRSVTDAYLKTINFFHNI